jgi:hypothetical protein
MPCILVAGSLAQRPGYAGHSWVFLQYLLGFKRLGFDVLFLDWLDETMCRDRAGNACSIAESWNLAYLQDIMREHGLEDAWSLNFDQGRQTLGRPRSEVLQAAAHADVLLNVMGFLSDWEILGLARKRVFLDIDPGFGQMWQDLGLATVFGGHDAYVTIGENIGQPDCTIPTCGLRWITSPQPVVLERWPSNSPARKAAFTSVVSWRGPFGPVEYGGKTYGLRVHEFRKFVHLPEMTGQSFDLALDIDASEEKDIALLRQSGWNLLDPRAAVSRAEDYRAFIGRSRAELMIAKNMYVESRGGWFSDRSICYLASGRPVLAQETGWSRNYPAGEGLLAFTTLEEAAAGVEEISANYARHSQAARELAEAHFDSDKVLARLLEQIG